MDRKIWIRNDYPTNPLKPGEFVGPLHQDSFVDPCSKSDFVHWGPTVEEMQAEGKIGVWMLVSDWLKKRDSV